MRGLVGTVGRYLDDARIDMGIARGNPDVWNQALAQGREAARVPQRAWIAHGVRQSGRNWGIGREQSGQIPWPGGSRPR